MAKRTQPGISGFHASKVVFHRNGICGRSFYTVSFSYVEDDVHRSNMLAVFPVDAQTQPGLGQGTECYVIDLKDPSNCMRGDNFVGDVERAIALHEFDSRHAFREALTR